jgi:hypothetical protein
MAGGTAGEAGETRFARNGYLRFADLFSTD